MNLNKSIQEINFLKLKLIKKLEVRISKLPDNAKINRINPTCFTIRFSDISTDRHLTMNPSYYDFKAQYKVIIHHINKCQLEKLIETIEKWIESGYIQINSAINGRFKLHPKVVNHLKEIIK